MSTLLFLLTVLLLLVLIVRLLIRSVRRRPAAPTLRHIGLVAGAYCVLWVVWYVKSEDRPVPLGTEVCFDDWCATITAAENPARLNDDSGEVKPQGHFILLHVKMSNHARGIAQKPSEPRIYITDGQGRTWLPSAAGQKVLERQRGSQPGIDARLELHEALETQIIFDVPDGANGLKALIEEGPPATLLLLPEDREVFPL